MFNKVFTFAAYPVLWTQNLKPIFKKGDICDPNIYRGIAIGSTMSSAMSKLFNLILLEMLEARIDRTHPVSVNQIEFKMGHRTADHTIVLSTIVNKIIKIERNMMFCVFIDFQKGYDKINRNLLLKLQWIGIGGLFYRHKIYV